jgi:hypothetical protein
MIGSCVVVVVSEAMVVVGSSEVDSNAVVSTVENSEVSVTEDGSEENGEIEDEKVSSPMDVDKLKGGNSLIEEELSNTGGADVRSSTDVSASKEVCSPSDVVMKLDTNVSVSTGAGSSDLEGSREGRIIPLVKESSAVD